MSNPFLLVSDNQAEQLNNLCEIINLWATEKGWNDDPDSVQKKSSDIALMHSELSECLEFVRAKPTDGCVRCSSPNLMKSDDAICCCSECMLQQPYETLRQLPIMDDHVPSLTGESAELADVLIRIFHYCGRRGINLGRAVQLKHEYNTSRPFKHGKNL